MKLLKFLCFTGLAHLVLPQKIRWVEHPEGCLGYWYCNWCGRTFDGCIHEPNPPRKNFPKRPSGNRIRVLSSREVRKELSKLDNPLVL